MQKYKRGITFGAYEIFHQGHYNLFKNAKEQCEELVVCVSDDDYIQTVKGHKPAIPFHLRKVIVESINYVDHVDRQSTKDSKKEMVKLWMPDVIFVGDDWTPETFTGEGLGVPVIYLPRTKGVSSTMLRN